MEDALADFVVLPDLTNEVTESLVDVDALFCRCLDELARKMFGEVTALCLSQCYVDFVAKYKADAPFMPTCRSYSKSHLLATTMTGNMS
jgi:hypothetical protein